MMKKFFKKCLITALTCGLATAAYAAEITPSVGGSVDTYIVSSGSSIDMMSYGDINVAVEAQAGGWTVSASQDIEMTGSTTGAISLGSQTITLEDESLSISAGYQVLTPYGITMGGAYAAGTINDAMMGVGASAPTGSATSNLVFTMKDLGLTALLSMFGSDTVFGVIYTTSFGDIDIAAELASGTNSGTSYSDIALAGSYKLSDSMAIALNMDMASGASSSTTTVFWFDMGLGDTSGVSFGYGTDGSNTDMELTYSTIMDALTLYATYFADGSANATYMGGGMTIAF